MRKMLFLLLAVCLALPGLGRAATPEADALTALDAANVQVLGLSVVKSPDVTNIDKVKGELDSLRPFFETVAQRLTGLPIDSSTRLLSLGASVSAKIETAGRTSTVDIALLLETCRGIVADLDAWRALLPDVRRALQTRIDASAQAEIRQQVNLTFPTPLPGTAQGPVSQPTPTAQAFATPLPFATPTSIIPAAPTPTPVAPVDGGLIPGGYVPPTPTPRHDDDHRPTAIPTPQGVRKAPVPVAAARNGHRVWVANVQAGSVSVMETKTQRFSAVIPVGNAPSSLALDDGDNTLVVANGGSASVTLVDARSDKVLKTITVAAQPVQALVTHGGKAYVACQEGRAIAVIDLKLQLLVKLIKLSSRPGRMDYPNSHQAIYVTLPDEDAVAVIDTGYDDVTATIAE